MSKNHQYKCTVEWTGNNGTGTDNYATYSRSHRVSVESKNPLECSSDPMFRGDATKYNPEELFLFSISSCHMLWYLHLCADANVIVTSYKDVCDGNLQLESNGSGKFDQITLHPTIVVTDERMIEKARSLHEIAHSFCFIAQSVNVPIEIQPNIFEVTK